MYMVLHNIQSSMAVHLPIKKHSFIVSTFRGNTLQNEALPIATGALPISVSLLLLWCSSEHCSRNAQQDNN